MAEDDELLPSVTCEGTWVGRDQSFLVGKSVEAILGDWTLKGSPQLFGLGIV